MDIIIGVVLAIAISISQVVGHQDYGVQHNSWCSPYHESFETYSEAERRCSSDPLCFMIYDDGGSHNHFVLCNEDANIETSSSGSLLHIKINEPRDTTCLIHSKATILTSPKANYTAIFKNDLPYPVDVIWMNNEQEEVVYKSNLAPGEEFAQVTYFEHEWIFKQSGTNNRLFAEAQGMKGETFEGCHFGVFGTDINYVIRVEIVTEDMAMSWVRHPELWE